MQSRSIQWKLSESFAYLLLSGSICLPAMAADDSPDIASSEDPLSEAFLAITEQRLLLKEPALKSEDSTYLELHPEDVILPNPVLVQPATDEEIKTIILAAAEPEAEAEAPPEWVLYQGNRVSRDAEMQVFAKINAEYARTTCIPGFDCPVEAMELAPWPEEEDSTQPPFEIFDTQLITPFAPIPELEELPFPTL